MSRITIVVVVAMTGCGSPDATTPMPEVCDKRGPIRLLDVSASAFGEWGAKTTTAADHVVVDVWGTIMTQPAEYAFAAYAVEQCGDSAVELLPKTERAEVEFGAAGPWVLSAANDTHDIHWVDPAGLQPDRRLFASAKTCTLRVAGGLAVIDVGGTLWFHSDPGDPSVEAVALAHDVRVPGTGPHFNGDFSCTLFDAERAFVEGDAVLVPEDAGPLVRISIPSGERETIIDATVFEFAVLDDPRYVLWLEGVSGTAACCGLKVRDREDGSDVDVGSEGVLGSARWEGRWVSTYVRDPPEVIVSTSFVDVSTGTRLSIEGGWRLEAQLSAARLLVQSTGTTPDVRILDVATGDLEVIDFPAPSPFDPKYTDGVLGFSADASPTRGTLKLLRLDETIATLGQVQRPYARMLDGTVVFTERDDDDDETGRLVMLRGGQRQVLDDGVAGFQIPFLASGRERAEVSYVVRDPPRAGVWRQMLP